MSSLGSRLGRCAPAVHTLRLTCSYTGGRSRSTDCGSSNSAGSPSGMRGGSCVGTVQTLSPLGNVQAEGVRLKHVCGFNRQLRLYLLQNQWQASHTWHVDRGRS